MLGRAFIEELLALVDTRHVEKLEAYAAGLDVDDMFLYTDDGTSGAELKRRPGFQRLMAALTP